MQFECLSKVVRLLFTVDNTAESVKFTLRKTSEHRDLQNISRAIVWHFELTTLFNLLSLLTVDMVQQSLAKVHRWSWHSWRPVKSWVVPLGQAFFSQAWVLTLVRNVIFVVPNFKEGVPFWKSVLYLLLR